MLYLNALLLLMSCIIPLFNFNKCCIWIGADKIQQAKVLGFNFNKCCIWIVIIAMLSTLKQNLTLTNVVFEFYVKYAIIDAIFI